MSFLLIRSFRIWSNLSMKWNVIWHNNKRALYEFYRKSTILTLMRTPWLYLGMPTFHSCQPMLKYTFETISNFFILLQIHKWNICFCLLAYCFDKTNINNKRKYQYSYNIGCHYLLPGMMSMIRYTKWNVSIKQPSKNKD